MFKFFKKLIVLFSIFSLFYPVLNIEARSMSDRGSQSLLFKDRINRREELLEILEESEEIYEAIDQYNDMVVEYADLYVVKKASAAVSGDYTLLYLDNEEYEYFRDIHNELIDIINVKNRSKLKIKFNNTDRITSYMMEVHGQLEDIEAERMKMDTLALAEAFSGK